MHILKCVRLNLLQTHVLLTCLEALLAPVRSAKRDGVSLHSSVNSDEHLRRRRAALNFVSLLEFIVP